MFGFGERVLPLDSAIYSFGSRIEEMNSMNQSLRQEL
jgi:hypothetical protein